MLYSRNVNLRAQDAPHSIGGALADQFSWYAFFYFDDICRWNKYKGITITLRLFGNTKNGCPRLQFSLRELIMQDIQSNVQMDWELSP